MGIIVGKNNPRVIGGIDAINAGEPEAVVDAAEKNEGLVDIDEVQEQMHAVKEEPEAPVEQPAPKKKSRKGKK